MYVCFSGNGVIVLISEDKKGYVSPRQYSGLTLPEVTEVIDRISQIHAVTTAMFLSNETFKADLTTSKQEKEVSKTLREDADLVFRTLAHFVRRVPGYLDKQQLICKYRSALVEHAITNSQTNTRYSKNTSKVF